MTRNPETTEARVPADALCIASAVPQTDIGMAIVQTPAGYTVVFSTSQPDLPAWPVLAVSPAVTEGERTGRRVPPPNYALAGTVSDEFGVRAAPSPAVTADPTSED